MLQHWFSMLSIPKEFTKGDKKKQLVYVIQNYICENFKGVCTYIVEFEESVQR